MKSKGNGAPSQVRTKNMTRTCYSCILSAAAVLLVAGQVWALEVETGGETEETSEEHTERAAGYDDIDRVLQGIRAH